MKLARINITNFCFYFEPINCWPVHPCLRVRQAEPKGSRVLMPARDRQAFKGSDRARALVARAPAKPAAVRSSCSHVASVASALVGGCSSARMSAACIESGGSSRCEVHKAKSSKHRNPLGKQIPFLREPLFERQASRVPHETSGDGNSALARAQEQFIFFPLSEKSSVEIIDRIKTRSGLDRYVRTSSVAPSSRASAGGPARQL
jgi:hypothetical protein